MIDFLKLNNFRKFQEIQFKFNRPLIIFVGPNATGKTSVLEAIYLIATTKSHRTSELEALIYENEPFAKIELQCIKNLKLILTKTGKQGFVNEAYFSKTSEFIGEVSVVMVSPSDIDLILGTKSIRRRFLDLELSLLDKSYLRSVMVYKKILKERNEILKIYTKDQEIILNVLTNQLIEQLHIIFKKRMDFLDTLNLKLSAVCKNLNCEEIKLTYISSYDIQNVEESYHSKLKYDILTKTTNIGIHRDDFSIKINELFAKDYASEGQMRNAVLAIKLALLDLYKMKNKDSILLLDDVFSSIDQKRINHILEYIKNEPQTFITTTSIFNIPDVLLKDAQIIKL